MKFTDRLMERIGAVLCRLGVHNDHIQVTWAYGVNEARCSHCGVTQRRESR